MKKYIKKKPKPYEVAIDEVGLHYLYGDVFKSLRFDAVFPDNMGMGNSIVKFHGDEIALLYSSGVIYFNAQKNYSKENWKALFSLMSLHYALGGFKKINKKNTINFKEEVLILLDALLFFKTLKYGELPDEFNLSDDLLKEFSTSAKNDDLDAFLYNHKELINFNFALDFKIKSLFFKDEKDITNYYRNSKNYEDVFAKSLVKQAQKTLRLSVDINFTDEENTKRNSDAYRAKNWFVSYFPLLSSLASSFDIVEDIKICQRLDIAIAAVDGVTKEIYINPLAQLSLENLKFVMAHEMLHVGLSHMSRREKRDAFLWNVACDFVINNWLIELKIGLPPDEGLLFDETLIGLSAEEIYFRISKDLRLHKKLKTFRGKGVDIFDEEMHGGDYFRNLDDFYRGALRCGLEAHYSHGRGDLPADMIEEIKRITQPPIPWEVELADWVRQQFPLDEVRRTYARPSRRQSSTPDIARPKYIKPDVDKSTKTFGVILDTSGSMDRHLLGKAIGAITSYALMQEVKWVRLIYADAAPYDEGYLDIEILPHRVKVKGRGGTVLQNAIDYLERVKDFPKDAPLLVITDGFCEPSLAIKRRHAFLIPKGYGLPFFTKSPVFYFS